MNKIILEVTTEKQRNELIEQLIKMEFKKELPKKAQELERGGFRLLGDGSYQYTQTGVDSHTFSSINVADKVHSISILSRAMKEYNDGWVADWDDEYQHKIVIDRYSDRLSINLSLHSYSFLSFKDRETATEFLKNFKKDIEIFFEI